MMYLILQGPRSTFNRQSSYPVFWVEAFNEAVQKWIPVDPLVTKSLAKSFKFEPPSSDPLNCMSYVVAFEEDASARDVTRRYAKAFNAKTRKLRVESTKDGERWWQRVLEFYEKPFLEDRDEIEISELTAKTAAEPMPRNVLDFKDHPIYALERHLRRNEVVFPKRAIGQVSLGKSGSKHEKLEPVYRRSDVHSLRSAEKWYRLGRDIKLGQQPMKRVPARRAAVFVDDEDSETAAETPLYSFSQTELYKPPPVVQGRIPKNVYGNLDVYVPTMVPPGGVHVIHPDSALAAKILGIDYADAVTGFDFKGRHGTAVFRGVVIATEYREALEEVIRGLEDEKMQAQLEQKSAESLRLWKHFLLKLRISERVKGYAVEGEDEPETSVEMGDDDFADAEDHGGGFIPEPDQEVASPSAEVNTKEHATQYTTVEHISASQSGVDDTFGGGFVPEDDQGTATALSQPEKKPNHLSRNTAERSRYTLVVLPNDATEKSSNVEVADTNFLSSPEVFEPGLSTDANPSQNIQAERVSFEAPVTVESTPGAGSKSCSIEAHSGAPSQSRIPSLEAPENDTESNEGSLLSQDPEDEDAIPEWLMSD